MHFDPAVPRDLRDRIRQLLQPRLVGAAAIMEHRMWIDDHLLVRRGRRRGERQPRHVGKPHWPRRRLAVESALCQRIHPVLIEVRGVLRLPFCLEIVLERPGLPGDLEDHVASRLRAENRLHHRLLQRGDARARTAVAPLLERMVIRQDQVAGGRRLIHVGREADLVSDFAERLLERAGHRVRRVRAMHE